MKPLKALIFDSYYDDYRGVILYARIFSGELKKGDEIKMMATDSKGLALEIGKLQPKMTPFDKISAGEIGYIKFSATRTSFSRSAVNSLPEQEKS
jgi:GTP-binding protein LepA